jgi:DNA-binding IclR family transcriptional regulator
VPQLTNQTLIEGNQVFWAVVTPGFRPMPFEEIKTRTGHGEQKLRRILTSLEASNLLQRDPSGCWKMAEVLIYTVGSTASDIEGVLAKFRSLQEAVARAKSVQATAFRLTIQAPQEEGPEA